ncbi:DUF4307 domain-containing protein [Nocardioides sp.]|uniref:DUF4307 domain-containing protein n=1 Tax=Nocardioides sp. TaxID=35761 RepID=UPI0031FEADF3|nr:hypothetical protein [Nocardioides sp.]
MTSQDLLAERYGAPRPWRRRVIVGGCVVLALVFLGWVGWTTWSNATPEVTSELVSFKVVDEHSASAVVDVRLADDKVAAACTLQAFAEDHSLVGTLTFTPDPGAGERYEEVIRTERRATSVDLTGCTAPGQQRPS